MRKLKWGVLGVAKIAVEKVIPAMQRGDVSEIAAIASRDLAKARARRRPARHPAGLRLLRGAAGRSGDRGDLQSAAQRSARALDGPRARGRQARAVREADRARRRGGRALIDARDAVRQDRRRGVHGAVPSAVAARPRAGRGRGRSARSRAIQTFFSYHLLDPKNIRNRPPGGGGALRHRLLRDPDRALHFRGRADAGGGDARPRPGFSHRPPGQRDRSISPAARHLTFSAARNCRRISACTIVGEQGRIEIEIPFNAPPDRPTEDHHRQRRGPVRTAARTRGIRRLRSVHAAGRRVFARRDRADAIRVSDRGRDRQHAGHRRPVPLGGERRVGGAVAASGRPSGEAAR